LAFVRKHNRKELGERLGKGGSDRERERERKGSRREERKAKDGRQELPEDLDCTSHRTQQIWKLGIFCRNLHTNFQTDGTTRHVRDLDATYTRGPNSARC